MDTLCRKAVEEPEDVGVPFEPRWPLRLALVGAILLYATLPDRVIPGPRIVVPAIESGILVVLAVTTPSRHHATLLHARVISIVLVGLVSASNIATLVLLSRELLHGTQAGGRDLVIAAIQIWSTNVIAFGFWYWELDRGGPVVRMRPISEHALPDLLFPQMVSPQWSPQFWRPQFLDYLYVSFTNATAFSPTDTMPLSRWAKMLMLVQSAISLALAVMVVARAVNILK